MKAVVSDANTLYALGPSEVAAYLRTHNWQLVDQIGTKGAVWTARLPQDIGGGDAELLLPLDRSLSDYVRRMTEVLRALEVTEERSQLDILRDIGDTNADVIRIHLLGASFEDGSLPIDQAPHVVAHAREMMLAAACATVQPRMIYRSRKPTPALEYMSKVRLGQTERGSYVLTIRSLVPPRLTGGQLAFPEMPVGVEASEQPEEQPFERRVTLRLAQALASTTSALSRVSTTGDMTVFQEAVEEGVSANLCDALVGLVAADNTQDIAIRMNWAPTRGISQGVSSSFRLASDTLPLLSEVARMLREQAPFGTMELRGPVVELRRDEGALAGQVVVAGVVDGKVRQVGVELFGADYDHAIKAHQFEMPIIIEGELVKDGRVYRLQTPRNLAVDVEG